MTMAPAEVARELPRATPPGPHRLDPAADLFHSLGDRSRLAILRHLALGEHRVVDLTAHLGLAQSTVSQHLACLRACGLVTSRAHGRSSVHALANPAATLALLRAAEAVLGSTGDAVELCPISGPAAAGPHR